MSDVEIKFLRYVERSKTTRMATVSKETITVLSYKYLRVGGEEARIRRLEFTFTRGVEALPRVHALVKSLLFLCLSLL